MATCTAGVTRWWPHGEGTMAVVSPRRARRVGSRGYMGCAAAVLLLVLVITTARQTKAVQSQQHMQQPGSQHDKQKPGTQRDKQQARMAPEEGPASAARESKKPPAC